MYILDMYSLALANFLQFMQGKEVQQRNPMFVFEFEGALFKFRLKAPAFAPLFQLPPRMNASAQNSFCSCNHITTGAICLNAGLSIKDNIFLVAILLHHASKHFSYLIYHHACMLILLKIYKLHIF